MSKKKSPAFRKKEKQILPVVVCFVLIAVFCGFMGYRSYSMQQTKLALEREVTLLQNKIEEEENRTEELKEFEIYTHTKMYAEEVAKDILGYVYDDEIIFKPEE